MDLAALLDGRAVQGLAGGVGQHVAPADVRDRHDPVLEPAALAPAVSSPLPQAATPSATAPITSVEKMIERLMPRTTGRGAARD
jgi:hypothetical protein